MLSLSLISNEQSSVHLLKTHVLLSVKMQSLSFCRFAFKLSCKNGLARSLSTTLHKFLSQLSKINERMQLIKYSKSAKMTTNNRIGVRS